jgi:hypothetical protein
VNIFGRGLQHRTLSNRNSLASAVTPGFPVKCNETILLDLLRAVAIVRTIYSFNPVLLRSKCNKFLLCFINLVILAIIYSFSSYGSNGTASLVAFGGITPASLGTGGSSLAPFSYIFVISSLSSSSGLISLRGSPPRIGVISDLSIKLFQLMFKD